MTNPVDFQSTTDFASMLSRGEEDVSLDIPDSFSLSPGAYRDFTKSIPAPNADTYYVRWKSSKMNKWKVAFQVSLMGGTFAPADWIVNGSCYITTEKDQITLHIMYSNPYDTSVTVYNKQTVHAHVMFFDQPL